MTLKCNVELLHQMMMTSAKRRDVPAALQKLEELRSILAVSPAVKYVSQRSICTGVGDKQLGFAQSSSGR
jgi:hypothetical protein